MLTEVLFFIEVTDVDADVDAFHMIHTDVFPSRTSENYLQIIYYNNYQETLFPAWYLVMALSWDTSV